MAFVNEQITEVDQERINYVALKDPQSGRSLAGRRIPRWAVDRERDAFLLRLGGGVRREDYKVPFYFLFNWRGVRIYVDAYRTEKPSNDTMLAILTWEVIRLQLPDTLPASSEEVMQTITEAFDTYGSNSYDDSRAMFSEVRVDFSKLREGNKP